MISGQSVPKAVNISLPSWLWGGAPAEFFPTASLRAQPVAGHENVWRVQTEERYAQTRPRLVVAHCIARPSLRATRFDFLTQLANDEKIGVQLGSDIGKKFDELAKRVSMSSNVIDSFHWMQVATSLARPDQVAKLVEEVYNGITSARIEGASNERPFRDAAVYAIERSEALVRRVKLVTVLLRIAHDEVLSQGALEHIKRESEAGRQVFASGQGLLDGVFQFDVYFGPLLGSMSPAVWGFSAVRAFGPVLYSLGYAAAGTGPGPMEMLQLLPSQPATKVTWSNTKLPPLACSDAIEWWESRLNDLFGVLSDPAVFVDANNVYSATRHHQNLLTVEQLFRRVNSILISHRDEHAQRVLFFTVLDTLDRLLGLDIARMCNLDYAEKTLGNLKESMSATVANVLLPLAERAVMALKDLQDGFFIAGMNPHSGPIAGLTGVAAVAQYIKVLRDATHGHGSNKSDRVEKTNALLANHDGNIPHDLPFLGYMYLLKLLTQPSGFRMRLYAGR